MSAVLTAGIKTLSLSCICLFPRLRSKILTAYDTHFPIVLSNISFLFFDLVFVSTVLECTPQKEHVWPVLVPKILR